MDKLKRLEPPAVAFHRHHCPIPITRPFHSRLRLGLDADGVSQNKELSAILTGRQAIFMLLYATSRYCYAAFIRDNRRIGLVQTTSATNRTLDCP